MGDGKLQVTMRDLHYAYLWRCCMKKLLFLLIVFACVAGCSKSKALQFCEGVSPDGDGVNCGTVFEDGELTALIRTEAPFGVKAITLQIFEVKGDKKEKTGSVPVSVRPDRSIATANLSFYSGGRYLVRAISGDRGIGEGEITIVER